MSQTSAQRKLTRGIEQFQTLCGEAEAFRGDKAYVFRHERELRSAHELAIHSFAIERKAPPQHWPLLAGESLNNMRSALDHAACAITPPKSNRQYPIFTDPCEFQVLGLKKLPGVPVAVRAAIEDTQPYRRLPQAPAKDALEILRTLSNIDKHRTLTAIACAITSASGYTAEDVTLRWEKAPTNFQLGHEEAEVSVLVATCERDMSGMDMEPHLSYQVRIEGRPLGFFPIVARRVFEAIGICENAGTPPPFSAYPL